MSSLCRSRHMNDNVNRAWSVFPGSGRDSLKFLRILFLSWMCLSESICLHFNSLPKRLFIWPFLPWTLRNKLECLCCVYQPEGREPREPYTEFRGICSWSEVKVAQSCPTLYDPMRYTVHGILQARILEWIAFPFSRGIFPTQGSNPGLPRCRWILYSWATRES